MLDLVPDSSSAPSYYASRTVASGELLLVTVITASLASVTSWAMTPYPTEKVTDHKANPTGAA